MSSFGIQQAYTIYNRGQSRFWVHIDLEEKIKNPGFWWIIATCAPSQMVISSIWKATSKVPLATSREKNSQSARPLRLPKRRQASVNLFPTCQVRVVRFYVRCAAPPSPPSPLSPPSPRRTSSASSWSQWSSPDLIWQFCLAVVVAGPHLRALDRSGPRQTSSATSWSQWASPDFNRRESERCGLRRTSTGESLSAVGLSGPQPARVWALWASPFGARWPRRTSTGEIRRAVGLAGLSPDLNGQKQSYIECQRECQIECQKICQIECQKICPTECQIEGQKIWQIECQKVCQIECQKIWYAR